MPQKFNCDFPIELEGGCAPGTVNWNAGGRYWRLCPTHHNLVQKDRLALDKALEAKKALDNKPVEVRAPIEASVEIIAEATPSPSLEEE
jgi:hypothetical protein